MDKRQVSLSLIRTLIVYKSLDASHSQDRKLNNRQYQPSCGVHIDQVIPSQHGPLRLTMESYAV